MRIQDIRKKSEPDLKKLLAETRENVRHLRFKIATKELKNPHLLKEARKDIARMLTVLEENINAK